MQLASKHDPNEEALFIFDTHPIQYRAPVFRRLSESGTRFRVFFFEEKFEGNRWWFRERDKIPPQPFGVELKSGYQNEVLSCRSLVDFYRRISSLLEVNRPRAILLYGYYLPEHWLLLLAASRKRIPVIFIGETFDLGGTFLRRILKSILRPLFFSQVSRFVSIGKKSFEFYQLYGVSPKKITKANYCIDTKFFESNKSAELRKQWRAKLGIAQKSFVILFVGRLFSRKRPMDVFALHESLSHRNVVTVIIGNGEDEKLIKERAAKTRGMHYLGFQNQEETKNAYHGSDLLYVPSEMETWGLVVNEAFSAHCPALLTDTCGAAGEIADFQTGAIVSVGNIGDASRQVTNFLDHPDEYGKMRDVAFTRVTKHFSIDQFANAIEKSLP